MEFYLGIIDDNVIEVLKYQGVLEMETGDDPRHEESESFDLFTYMARDRISQVQEEGDMLYFSCAEVLEMVPKNSRTIFTVMVNHNLGAIYFEIGLYGHHGKVCRRSSSVRCIETLC